MAKKSATNQKKTKKIPKKTLEKLRPYILVE